MAPEALNLEERNVGTKGKSPKRDLASAKYLFYRQSNDSSSTLKN